MADMLDHLLAQLRHTGGQLPALEFGVAQRAQVLGQIGNPAVVEREPRLPGLLRVTEWRAGGGVQKRRPEHFDPLVFAGTNAGLATVFVVIEHVLGLEVRLRNQ